MTSDTNEFRRALVDWAAGGVTAADSERGARALAGNVRRVALMEGTSDVVALETAAELLGQDLRGAVVVPMGGAMSIGRFLPLVGELGIPCGGLCDAAEARFFARPLGVEIDQLGAHGFFLCEPDLETEFIVALGVEATIDVINAHGDGKLLRTFLNQPAQRQRPLERQLHRFLGTTSGRKAFYARWCVEACGTTQIPRPLTDLLAFLLAEE